MKSLTPSGYKLWLHTPKGLKKKKNPVLSKCGGKKKDQMF